MAKRRQKLKAPPGEAGNAAKTDKIAAELLAPRGPRFTNLETDLNSFYTCMEDLKRIEVGQKTIFEERQEDLMQAFGKDAETVFPAGARWDATKRDEYRKSVIASVERHSKMLSTLFLNAVISRDTNKLKEIGEALEFLKSFAPRKDNARANLLGMKPIIQCTLGKIEISILAKAIRWKEPGGKPGHPELRKLCQQLKIPIKTHKHGK